MQAKEGVSGEGALSGLRHCDCTLLVFKLPTWGHFALQQPQDKDPTVRGNNRMHLEADSEAAFTAEDRGTERRGFCVRGASWAHAWCVGGGRSSHLAEAPGSSAGPTASAWLPSLQFQCGPHAAQRAFWTCARRNRAHGLASRDGTGRDLPTSRRPEPQGWDPNSEASESPDQRKEPGRLHANRPSRPAGGWGGRITAWGTSQARAKGP